MMRVEQLDTDDHVMDVRDLGVLHHEELGGSREFDSAAVVISAQECQKQPDRQWQNCWIVYDDNNVPVGYLAATACRSYYSFRTHAQQQMWFVLPKYRGTKAALLLLKAFEAWTKSIRAEIVFMSVEHNTYDEAVSVTTSLMNKLGYQTRGVLNIKHLG